jgi:elongator complex protein 3
MTPRQPPRHPHLAPPGAEVGREGAREQWLREKLKAAREQGWRALPSNPDLWKDWSPEERARWAPSLRLKPTRTLSGVTVVAVMTSPFACPHGRCTYCPGGPEARTPQSYTGEEPSALRGAQFDYDPYRIVRHRLDSLEEIGHPVSKVELILMGGTFTSRPVGWQERTIQQAFDGLNGRPSPSLSDAHATNESAASRCVGLTVETRPDQAGPETLRRLVSWGVTRVEFGVEALRDGVLAEVHRAHDVRTVVEATGRAREFGLKVGYHMMPGLPGMDPQRDREDFSRLFAEEDFRPDLLKIYPCLVIAGTPLADAWARGAFEPYDTDTAAELLADIKQELPPYVRIHRVQRDIPSRLILAGVRKSNLREIALARLRARGRQCPCLRCREAGRRPGAPGGPDWRLGRREYRAQGGREVFLSLEDAGTDAVAGYLRLRFPRGEVPGALEDPVIRELKVLGSEVPLSAGPDLPAGTWQHRGFGRSLLKAAEEEARSEGARRLAVIAAVGTRPYYARLGFERFGPWMAKPLGPRQN